nr:PREDICTED: uncharacterized protein LOC105661957 [Megachile rotundata]
MKIPRRVTGMIVPFFQIPFFMALSLVSATRLSLLPYAYLSAPFPVTHHFQDTRTGVHAYSYAGGPSAKEEIKDADGVLRGSYSYVDANGILQSVFYIADENGFRVAATNLPTDDNLEPAESHILLARSADSEKSSRKKRSAEESPQNPDQKDVKNISDQGSSSEPQQLSIPSNQQNESQDKIEKEYGVVIINPGDQPSDTPLETKPAKPQFVSVPNLFESLLSDHENRNELYKQLGIEGSKSKNAVKIDPEPITVVPSSVAVPLTSPVIAKTGVPLLSVIANEPLPVIAAQLGPSVATSFSNQAVTQIHGPSRADIAASNLVAKPVATSKDAPAESTISREVLPVVPLTKAATSTVTTTISSHGVSQIHGNSRIEPALLVKATPIAQLHTLVNLPIYLR